MASRRSARAAQKRRPSATKIARFAMCENCLQYKEDCQCCASCGGCEVHEHGCEDAETKPRLDARQLRELAERRTMRGLGPERRVVVKVGDARGDESTGELRRSSDTDPNWTPPRDPREGRRRR